MLVAYNSCTRESVVVHYCAQRVTNLSLLGRSDYSCRVGRVVVLGFILDEIAPRYKSQAANKVHYLNTNLWKLLAVIKMMTRVLGRVLTA